MYQVTEMLLVKTKINSDMQYQLRDPELVYAKLEDVTILDARDDYFPNYASN